jgi:signal transduction histidine kinase
MPLRVLRDLACVIVLTVLAGLLGAAFDASESFYRWSRNGERFQFDELPGTLLVFALAGMWFAWRRYRDACYELARRRELEQKAEQLLAENRRLANQAIDAQEAERRHLARELHDELGQYLNAITLDAARIRDLAAEVASQRGVDGGVRPGHDRAGSVLPERDLTAEVREDADSETHRLALAVMQSANYVYRQIGAMVRRLHPIGLNEFGLPSALEHCVDSWRERLPDASFTLRVEGDFEGLGDTLNITLYRLVQEGLTNVSKFARRARVEIFVVRTAQPGTGTPDEIVVTMADDGPGADLSQDPAGLGLVGMRERVEALGGEFHVASEPQRGFLFCARLPARNPVHE